LPELSVAVVGCGGAGNVHLGCWTNVSAARIAAICDRNGSAVSATALQYPGAAAFTDLDAMLQAGPFDVLDVCVTPDEQAAVARAGLLAGAHVLCEKPVGTDASEAGALAALAASRERLLMPAFCHRFHPPTLLAAELLQNDELGAPRMFRFRLSGLFAGVEATWLSDRAVSGGGALIDTAIHGIDLFRALIGEPAVVSGRLSTVRADLSVEDTAALLLQTSGGAIGVVEAGWSSPGGRNVIEIYGTAGACIVDYDDGTARFLTADRPVWRRADESGPNRFERMIFHFADAIRGLQPLMVDGEDAVRAHEICAEVYRQNGPDSNPPGDQPG
jgi:predicted dehydrogenase